MQIRRLDDRHDSRKQRQTHHDANTQFLGEAHLQIPKRADRDNGENDVCHRCVCTNPVVEVVEHRRIPACTLDRSVPQLLGW